jgi:hypothetical protein
MAPSLGFRVLHLFVGSMSSPSMMVILPTPARARNSAQKPPTPPSPTTSTCDLCILRSSHRQPTSPYESCTWVHERFALDKRKQKEAEQRGNDDDDDDDDEEEEVEEPGFTRTERGGISALLFHRRETYLSRPSLPRSSCILSNQGSASACDPGSGDCAP